MMPVIDGAELATGLRASEIYRAISIGMIIFLPSATPERMAVRSGAEKAIQSGSAAEDREA